MSGYNGFVFACLLGFGLALLAIYFVLSTP